ncbi:MAG: RagB/SusD family nutrient uptake outer membrane protein [Prolixibacteraceae bacterium]|jgi:hypothetical protein|nr:RagB/SusD family nutrient uptake outer membrane protein [Prolixibacteraceae bacterium]
MKIKILFLLMVLTILMACNKLNLNPLAEGSSENWYSNETEIEMAVSDLFREVFWPRDNEEWTDDFTRRNELTPITDATINGQWSVANNYWANGYKVIARANVILANLGKAKGNVSAQILEKFEAEAKFVRAAQYAMLISYFGDVIFSTDILDLEKSFTLSRTDKSTVLKSIYEDFDYAIAHLPVSFGSSENKMATKGAALAYKARIALYNQDWAIAGNAAKACIDLGVYQLYSDFGTLFLSKTKNTKENVFVIPRSVALNVYFGPTDATSMNTRAFTSRNAGGLAWRYPSWELFCSFLCSDGLPIDESPLFNPRTPFKNRDPRCAATIVEFQTRHLGFMYQPHPDSLTCYNFNSGKYQKNNDTRANAQFASFNGLLWKKGIDEDWSDDGITDPDKMLMRYADVLLMYAEAKIEAGEIDATVLNAINQVRARAYKAIVTATSAYPAVTTTNKDQLRKIVRLERRMEFALEGIRYMDIIRWKLADKVLNNDSYGILEVAALRTKIVKPGLWFFPETPPIDDDGVADFSSMFNKGLIQKLADRRFDASKQYLWPLPTKEILINQNLRQNPGY